MSASRHLIRLYTFFLLVMLLQYSIISFPKSSTLYCFCWLLSHICRNWSSTSSLDIVDHISCQCCIKIALPPMKLIIVPHKLHAWVSSSYQLEGKMPFNDFTQIQSDQKFTLDLLLKEKLNINSKKILPSNLLGFYLMLSLK